MPPPPAATPAKQPEKAAAATPPPGAKAAKKQADQTLAMANPPPKQEPKKVPNEALVETPGPKQAQAEASGASKTIAYITAGVALVALGGGAYAMSAANSAHADLTGSVHTGAEAQSLLEQEQKNKTLSFVGFATGLVAAGIATALFVF